MRKSLLILLILVGCSTQVPVPIKLPDKPLGIEPAAPITNEIYWKVIDGGLSLSASDGVKMNAERKDQLRYTKQLQNLVCYYESRHTFCKENLNLIKR